MAQATVRQEKFGQDLGLIHEVLVTGREVGFDKAFWAKLAHNRALCSEIEAIVTAGSEALEHASNFFRFIDPEGLNKAEAASRIGLSAFFEICRIPIEEQSIYLEFAKQGTVLLTELPVVVLSLSSRGIPDAEVAKLVRRGGYLSFRVTSLDQAALDFDFDANNEEELDREGAQYRDQIASNIRAVAPEGVKLVVATKSDWDDSPSGHICSALDEMNHLQTNVGIWHEDGWWETAPDFWLRPA